MSTGASVTGIVRAPINKVWEAFRPFGPEIMKWWPIYEWLRLEAPGKDEVGAVRSFKTLTGREYKERLEVRDDQNHVYKYSLVEAKPSVPSLTSIITSVHMSAKSATETLIDWSAEIEGDQTFAGQIVSAQEKTYTEAIKALDQHFHPNLGKLEVQLISGIDLSQPNLFQPDPYVVLNLDEGKPQQSNDSGEKLPPTQEMTHEAILAFIEHLQDEIKAQLLQIMKQHIGGEEQKYEYQRYPRRKDAPDLPMEEFPRMVKGLPPGQALPPKKLGLLSERVAEYVYSEIGFIQRLQQLKQSGGDPWTAYYAGWVQQPINIPKTWKDDVEFCRQLIQGVNPMCITLCTDQTVIPKEMAHLTAQGKTIPELIAEKRLFMLDYGDLEGIPQLGDKVFYPAFVLVYRELLEGGKSRLNMLGIQLTRHKDRKNEVYTPNSLYPNKYLLAKIHAACADDQYHQFTIHLGFAHLAVEPFAISHHNAFPKEHPIGQLLKPHFQDTIGINYLARQTLVSNVAPFTDRTFSTGTAGGLQLVLKAWRKWDFFGMSFPQQLLSRGFDEQGSDGVEDFFFREDGFKIWNAYTEYVSNVVAAVYKDDAAVKADPVIQAWARETADPERGAVPGFPATIETRELLVKTLTNIIFLASAQHSAINFSQYQALGYVPNRPNVLFKGVPETEGDISMEYVLSALQPFAGAHFQVFFSRLLSTASLHSLSDLPLGNNLFPDLYAIFMAKLNLIDVEIEERNKKLLREGKVPYPYLSPKHIASSVDI